MDRLSLVAVSLALASSALGQLTTRESEAVDRALGLWNMAVSDLGFEKKLYHDPYRLPIVDRALSAPFEGLEAVMGLQAGARSARDADSLLNLAWRQLQPSGTSPSPATVLNNDAAIELVPASCRSQVVAAVNIYLEAVGLVNQALGKLSAQERADLLATLPQLAEAQIARLAPGPTGRVLARDAALRLLGRVDLWALELAGRKLAKGLAPIIARLQTIAPQVTIPKPIRFEVLHVQVLIATTGDDLTIGRENELVIDLRGNDRYRGRIGSGILGCGVLIDLGGNDAFELGDVSGGAGLLGCGGVFAVGGNDRVVAKAISLGAGIVGAGWYSKVGGHDDYRSTSCSQGFGFFGVGLMLDTKGNDRYDATDSAQGSALTKGFGWLVDSAGSDLYTIGGRVSGAPLDPASWHCMGQGAASGFREDSGGVSGGVGLLSDLAGDDVYKGGMYCQGASYWFALGALMDDQGNDTYVADYYAQAAAMHLCAAYLVDLQGDDMYSVRTGAMQAIGHDYGVATMLDRAGNDVYSGGDSRPAQGIANGVGIGIDSAGNDRYFGPPGVGNASRGTGSIGLFVDISGTDVYGKGLSDGEAALTGTWGIAVDIEGPQVASGPAAPPHVRPQAGSLPMPSVTELERAYVKAVQWGVGSLQKEVEDNVDRLVAVGLPALEWMLRTKLASADRLALRAFDAVIAGVGDPGKAAVVPYVGSKAGDAALNALRLATTHKIAAVEPHLKDCLLDDRLRSAAIRAAAAIKAVSLVPALVGYAEGKDQYLALAALQALDEIGSQDAVYTFVNLATSPELPVRKTAIKALAKWPERALEAAKVLLTREARPLRAGIELLGEIGTDEALKLVVAQLAAKDAGARMEAVRVLGARDPAKYVAQIEALAKDPDPDVRALVRWAMRTR